MQILNNFTHQPIIDSKGVLYISYGIKHAERAIYSLESLKNSNPDVKTCICAEIEQQHLLADFDFVYLYDKKDLLEIQSHFVSRMHSFKLLFLHKTPFSQTIFLDTDTYVLQSLLPFFNKLDYYDLITTRNAVWKWIEKDNQKVKTKLLKLSSEYGFDINGGVFGYNKNLITSGFIDEWLNLAKNKPKWDDQFSLKNILENKLDLTHNIKWSEIDNKIYNCVGSMWRELNRQNLWQHCVILHSQLLLLHRHKMEQDLNNLLSIEYLNIYD